MNFIHQLNGRAAAVAVASFLFCLGLFVVASGPLRGLVGDVLIIVLWVAALATVGIGSPRSRAVGMFAVGVALEGFQALQLVGADAHWLLHLTVGSTADPLDIVAYGVGAVLALGLEGLWAR